MKWEARASGQTRLLPTAAWQGCIPWRHTKGWATGGHSPAMHWGLPERKQMAQDDSAPSCWPWVHPVQKQGKAPHHPGCVNSASMCFRPHFSPGTPWQWNLQLNYPINSWCGLTHVCAHRAMASHGEDSQQLNWVPAQTLTKEESREVLRVFFKMLWYLMDNSDLFKRRKSLGLVGSDWRLLAERSCLEPTGVACS